jgi:hypothetical protein
LAGSCKPAPANTTTSRTMHTAILTGVVLSILGPPNLGGKAPVLVAGQELGAPGLTHADAVREPRVTCGHRAGAGAEQHSTCTQSTQCTQCTHCIYDEYGKRHYRDGASRRDYRLTLHHRRARVLRQQEGLLWAQAQSGQQLRAHAVLQVRGGGEATRQQHLAGWCTA